MLRVARVRDSTGRYYLADLVADLDQGRSGGRDAVLGVRPGGGRAGDRHDAHDGHDGRWVGAGADGLALRGRVDAAGFGAVLSGCHPTRGHRLRVSATTVSAYDLTFAAPKSASVLSGLGTPDVSSAVRDAHEDAVDAATAYVERHAATVRRTDPDGRSVGAVGGIVAASFTHHVSRALDPHLHSHVVVANLGRGDDGRWRALDSRGLFAHATAAGALYDAVLRHGVSARLGLEWSPRHPRGWELSAIDPVLVGVLSSRRAEILADLDRHTRRTQTPPSGRARAVAWASTRDAKTPGRPADEQRTRWAEIARDAGCPLQLVVDGPPRAPRAEIDEHRFAAAIYETGQRGVARRDVIRAWALALGTGAPAASITRCVDALCDWRPGTGVADTLQAPAAVVPRGDVLRVLGPRPASPERLSVWLSGAAEIGQYRARWEARDGLGESRALGGESRAELAAMPARRLADHLSTVRAIDEALCALGRRRDRDRDLERDRARSGVTGP